jgi:hypothetical protein
MTFKAKLPERGEVATQRVAEISLAYGENNAWWNQRARVTLELERHSQFFGYNKVGNSLFDLSTYYVRQAARILGTGFEELRDQIAIAPNLVFGFDASPYELTAASEPQIRLDEIHHYDHHGRIKSREKLLFARPSDALAGNWPYDEDGKILVSPNDTAYAITKGGGYQSQTLAQLLSCNNIADSYYYARMPFTGHPHSTKLSSFPPLPTRCAFEELDLDLLLSALKRDYPKLTKDHPAVMALYKTISLESQRWVTELGAIKGINTYSDLSSSEQQRVLRRVLATAREQLHGLLTPDTPEYNAKLAHIIDQDAELKFLQPESYCTSSSLTHVVDGIQNQKDIGNTNLLASLFEQLGYTHKYRLKKADAKIWKYGLRVVDILKRISNDTSGNYTVKFTKDELHKIEGIQQRMIGEHKTKIESSLSPTQQQNFSKILADDMNHTYQLVSKTLRSQYP